MGDTLDVATLPLQGSRVIEASAGTGKTWTVAALVLRLVLGHGTARPLHPREILVMSFTQAATRELVERIRERLAQAAAAFREPEEAGAPEPLLCALRAAQPTAGARAEAARRLARAAEAMDEAAVHTIDAWCQRVLREHAFDSGSALDETLVADETELRRQALRDWWRAEVYPLQGDALALVRTHWPDVEALERALVPLLKVGDVQVAASAVGLGEMLERWREQRAATLHALKQGWIGRVQTLLDWLRPLWAVKKDKPIDGTQLGEARATAWLQSVADWAADPSLEWPAKITDAAERRLAPAGVAEALRQPRPIPSEFAELAALLRALRALPTLGAALDAHAHAQVSARLQAQKQRASLAGFADLQRRLADALDPEQRGEAAAHLRARILARYPVALIDECQDTSPVQMALFERVWGLGHDDPERTLLLIGDPKQSIYRFRGADIQGFLRARRAAGPRVHGLAINFRSTPELVGVVNAVFGAAEEREAEGAFRFGRTEDGAALLPFEPVRAQGRADRIAGTDGPVSALTVALDLQESGLADARQRLAAACAEQVVAWLGDPTLELHDTRGSDRAARRVRPRDVAVLVRGKAEADAVRAALARRGVRSVYLSEKDSVFAEPEAADLLRLLRAVADPSDGRAVRAALASAWVGTPLDALRHQADDDAWLEARVDDLLALRAVWRGQGVLALLRQALQTLVAPVRWRQPGAERTLTNTLHLAELLQAASESHRGEAALLRWLAREIDAAARDEGAPEEQLLRLESDADLVTVVTVHKSKGLQYRLVCVPFASLPVPDRPQAFVILPGSGVSRAVRFAPDEAALADERAEQSREALRLLYVALTRAEHALWVGAAAVRVGSQRQNAWHRSPLGWLVSGAAELDGAAVLEQVEAWVAALPHARLQPLLSDGAGALACTPWVDAQALRPLRPPRPGPASSPPSWAVGSYSGFVRGLEGVPARGWRDDEVLQAALTEAAEDVLPAAAPLRPRAAPWHRFPRGTGPGQWLHTLLEDLAGGRFELAQSGPRADAMRARIERLAPQVEPEALVDWLVRLCHTPLPPFGSALSALPRVWAEMEFWLPVERLDAARVDALCRAHVLPGRDRPALPARRLRGLLMGFADLVLQTPDGRFGVLDHKSNALGEDDSAYGDAALADAVLQHRYDVQGALYLVALHRLLRHRLGAGYRPEAHLHGAVFLFLRGIAAPGAGAWHLAPVRELIDGLDALFAAPSEAA